jgi:hypothetical protein
MGKNKDPRGSDRIKVEILAVNQVIKECRKSSNADIRRSAEVMAAEVDKNLDTLKCRGDL